MPTSSASPVPTRTLPTESVPVSVLNAAVTIRHAAHWNIVELRNEAIMVYRMEAEEQRTQVAAQLVGAGLVSPTQACSGLQVNYESLQAALHAIDPELRQAVLPIRPGPRGAWKLTAARQQRGAVMLRNDPQATLGEVTAAVNRGRSEPLSRRHVQRWRQTEQTRLQPRGSCDPAQGSGNSEPELPLGGVTDSVSPETTPPPSVEPPGPAEAVTSALLTRADRRYLEQLQQGVETMYGGGLLALPFLNAVNFRHLVKTLRLPDLGYTALQMALAFFFLSWLGFPTVEATRWMSYTAFGVLLGRRRGPGMKTLRAFLKRVQVVERAEAFTIAVARQLITMGAVEWRVLFLDGHFIPYFGQHAIRHGYFTVRRLAIKGQQAFYANDRRGRPLLVLLQPGSAKLYAVIPEMIGLLKRIVGSRWGRWVLTLVFDRGGWRVEFLQKLDQAQVYWVTWLELTQATQDWIEQLPDAMFELHTLQLNTTETQVWLTEVGVYIPRYGFCRAVVIDDRDHRRRIALGSNDHDRPLTDLAQLLLLRWGQENFFKRRKAIGTLDAMPGYDFEVTPDDPPVDNPQIDSLRKDKSQLQARLERLRGQLGANLLERKRDTIEVAQYKAQHDQLIQDIADLEHQVEALKLQLKALPKQVPISQVLGQPLEQADSERKTFLDTLAILADQAESSLLDILAQVDHGRDHRIVLHTILHHGAVVQLLGSTLQVRLKPFDSPRLRRLAETLCEALTAQKAHTLDKFGFLVVYEVMPSTL
jgi:hypothetical protein